ncbi:dihydrolipoamide acetyltransferase family protein [Verrucomicrobiota bacterium]
METILLPQIGQDITKGKIVEWLKSEGDSVEKGEVIATVESEKAVFDVEADASGVLLKILFHGGEEAEVLKPIGYIGEPGEEVMDDAGASAPAEKATAPAPAATPAAPAKRGGKSPASPVAKRMATELGVDLSTVTGSGPGGRIRKEDVLAAAEGPTPSPRQARGHPSKEGSAEGEVVEFTGMRKVIAERLSRSKQTIPHIYLFIDIDMENALAWRKKFNAENDPSTSLRAGVHITVTDQIIYAVSRALKAFPRLNGYVTDGALTIKSSIDIGVATATDDGLLVPVVKGADTHSIAVLSAEIKRLVAAAREKKMEANVVGTFTVTSLGMFGIREFIPIINPPECGILGVGAVEARAVPQGPNIVARQMMTLALAADHRAIDGVYAAEFLGRIKGILETDSRQD